MCHLGWADRFEDFQKAKKSLGPQLRGKQPAARMAALKKLESFPLEDSVRLIYGALSDADDRVRETAYATMLKMSGNQEVCDTLMLLVKKHLGRNDDGQMAAPGIAVLLSSSLPSVQRDSLDFVDQTVAAGKQGPPVMITLAEQLGRHGQAVDVPPLVRLSKTRVFAEHFGLRRTVVNSLKQIRAKEAIGGLIAVMQDVEGEARADAAEHLTSVTGQIFGMEAEAWSRWWEDSQKSFELPERAVEAPYRSVSLATTAEGYYGLPLFAEKLVFVLDTSGSMKGSRLAAAKRELVKAIDGLPESKQFAVVVFNGTVDVWQRQLTQADEESKKAAIQYVNAQTPRANTASYDALEAAMLFDTEAIYFLSDGAPYGGKISAPVDIVAAITEANRTRKISIYTIGIAAGFPGSPLDEFLKTLAARNLGLYRRVDH
jgi:hypothetical protein